MTATNSELSRMDRPACQAANPSLCSNCNMAYDCSRVRSGRPMSWAVVAIALLGAAFLLSQAAAGLF
jgi:hypothetical protein